DPQIDELREFRDGWLLNNPLGRAAVYTYYEISPSIARAAGKNEILKELLRRTVVQPALKLTRTLFGKRE
ncbi:MAG: CFI-box-CTERM domain-containing protein, partial [Candidatus Thorarchaeota archaeon]